MQWICIGHTLSWVAFGSFEIYESVLYFPPGSITQVEKFKYHPDRKLRELASNLPGLMLKELAPNSVKKYYNAFVRWQIWSKSKSISALPADTVGFCFFWFFCFCFFLLVFFILANQAVWFHFSL